MGQDVKLSPTNMHSMAVSQLLTLVLFNWIRKSNIPILCLCPQGWKDRLRQPDIIVVGDFPAPQQGLLISWSRGFIAHVLFSSPTGPQT